MTKIMTDAEKREWRRQHGMLPEEIRYMRGDVKPAVTSVPVTTSKYLNSPLFRDAFTTMCLRRQGSDIPSTYDIPTMSRGIADVTDWDAGIALVAAEKERLPEFAAWLDARKPIRFDVERIARCAEGTFGHAVHDFMVKSGYNMKFVANYEAVSDWDYLSQVIGHSHDLSHIVTGFGTNMAGEQAVTSFCTAATFGYFSPEAAHFINFTTSYAMTVLIPRALFNYPAAVPIILEATRVGIEAGQAMKKPFYMLDFDEYLDWQLEDLTRHLGFERGPGHAWDYTEALCSD